MRKWGLIGLVVGIVLFLFLGGFVSWMISVIKLPHSQLHNFDIYNTKDSKLLLVVSTQNSFIRGVDTPVVFELTVEPAIQKVETRKISLLYFIKLMKAKKIANAGIKSVDNTYRSLAQKSENIDVKTAFDDTKNQMEIVITLDDSNVLVAPGMVSSNSMWFICLFSKDGRTFSYFNVPFKRPNILESLNFYAYVIGIPKFTLQAFGLLIFFAGSIVFLISPKPAPTEIFETEEEASEGEETLKEEDHIGV